MASVCRCSIVAPPSIAANDVRGIVSEMLTADASGGALDPAELNLLIEQYLMDDPAILGRMAAKLSVAKRAAEQSEQVALLRASHEAIYNDPANVILGNPNGDVTLVEMFDYDYGYCRRALPDLATLIAEDPDLKSSSEFPIRPMARSRPPKSASSSPRRRRSTIGTSTQRLFSARGQVDTTLALAAAEAVGGNRVAMMIDMGGEGIGCDRAGFEPRHRARISWHADLHHRRGTDPRAPVGVDALETKIANMRACGATDCDA